MDGAGDAGGKGRGEGTRYQLMKDVRYHGKNFGFYTK